MEDFHKSDKQNRRVGIAVSIGTHLLVLILFYFLLAWSEPDPPIPEYGIEIGLVSNTVRSSSQNTTVPTPRSSSESEAQESESNPESDNVEEVIQDTEETEQPASEESSDVAPSETESPDPVNEEEVNEDTSNQEEVAEESSEESNDSDTSQSSVEDASADTSGTGEDNVSEEEEEAKEVDERALYPGRGDDDSTSATSDNNGASLDLSGWVWDFEPEPNDQSTENGRIVFEIKVDDEGEILQIRTVTKTVSPVVEKIYKDAVMELTFSKTSDNRSTASVSTGRITFIIQSN